MKLNRYLYGFAFLLLLQGCVKDTDFDQTDEIVFTPEIEADLIYFNLDADLFFDAVTNTPRFVATDTTALEFLDDATVTGSIKKVDFLFDIRNTIPRSFDVDFEFLTNNNTVTYETGTAVSAGSTGNEVQTLFTEEVVGEELSDIKNASKVVVNVTIPESDATVTGNLVLQSKATYYIEY